MKAFPSCAECGRHFQVTDKPSAVGQIETFKDFLPVCRYPHGRPLCATCLEKIYGKDNYGKKKWVD